MNRLSENAGGIPSIRKWIKQAAKRINALGNIQITRSGTGDSVTMSENGVLINLRRIERAGATASSGEASVTNPFAVLIREDPSSPGDYQAGVYFDSQLSEDLDPANTISITGLLNSAETTGWLACLGTGTDKVWIEGVIGTYPDVSSVTVKSLGAGDSFGGGVVEHDDAASAVDRVQTKFRVVLADIDCSVTPPVVSRQFTRNHLRMTNIVYADAKNSSGSNPTFVGAVYPDAV